MKARHEIEDINGYKRLTDPLMAEWLRRRYTIE
jgi:hypothetical protein